MSPLSSRLTFSPPFPSSIAATVAFPWQRYLKGALRKHKDGAIPSLSANGPWGILLCGVRCLSIT